MSTEIEVLRKFLAEHENSDPLETARVFGIDISLLQHHLSMSQKERIRRLQQWMRLQSGIQWSKSKN